MQLKWENYEPVAKKILGDQDLGLFIVAEEGEQIVGYIFFTFEWSDWRDGLFLWAQGLELDATKSDEEKSKIL